MTMKLDLKAAGVLRNPWNWDAATLEWARKELALSGATHCPHGYGECERDGCCYPGRCGKFKAEPAEGGA